MQVRWRRIVAVFQIARQQGFVLFNQLVDQRPMGSSHRGKISRTFALLEHVDHPRRSCRRQIEKQAGRAKPRADVGHQCRQIEVVGIDPIDHQHATQLALAGITEHAFRHGLDTILCVDDDQCGVRRRQRGHRLRRMVGCPRGIDELQAGALVGQRENGGIHRMPGRFFLCLEIAQRRAALDTAFFAQHTTGEQKGFRQGGLARTGMAEQGQGA